MAEYVPHRQHFNFEMYAPTSITESGIPIVERASVHMEGNDLSLYDVIAKFEDFLKACGYSLNDKIIDLVER